MHGNEWTSPRHLLLQQILHWITVELVGKGEECYGIYYGVKLFEDLLDNRYFILKTDHMNLIYVNVTFTGNVLRWKLCLQDKDFDLFHVPGKEEHQFVPDASSRLCTNHAPPPPTLADRRIVALRPVMVLPPDIHARSSTVHNSKVDHWELDICKRRLREARQRQEERDITDRMISEFMSSDESYATPDQSSSIYMCFI